MSLKKEMNNMFEVNGTKYICPLDFGFNVIRGKWKAVILCHLGDGAKRYLELQKTTCGISQKILTEQLRSLEQDGLITKIVYPEVPPKVEYFLTNKGQELYPALKMIESWSTKHYTFEKEV